MSLLQETSRIRAHARTLAEFIRRGEGKLAILTGAGISTDSGVPDYRGPTGIYVRNKDYRPIRFQEFISSHPTRQRYWSRSYLGYPRIVKARPNTAHYAVEALRKKGWVSGLITQNVDGLHLGEKIELHGTLHEVHCLSCQHTVRRSEFQQTVADMNPELVEWARRNPNAESGDVASSTEVRPDGDVETSWDYSRFHYPDCEGCGKGMYKPSVVFFGENIRQQIRDQSFDLIDASRALLCIGTSLQVYSAFRLAQRAKLAGQPCATLSLGTSRADELMDAKIQDGCGEVLEAVCGELGAS
ncbi:DHS-like NAD/FAD-binding domain-containing protein [Fimicolochytrium jonesii]|uniref:DHS-like NAD/FAD-binding domain-containing protein n=1 Tax=Fimicolochytrium jonesii TaxID=1396493 RepID=UPI0022FED014|nr:DHS-like NAD/FAD-binding domain-containing protein [Fimicolochytrium jonesii]KAI8821366.1 DHS-like NAD/FAD-binding domain-containing protein [Fimicolochytrium jonesii]